MWAQWNRDKAQHRHSVEAPEARGQRVSRVEKTTQGRDVDCKERESGDKRWSRQEAKCVKW